MKKLTCLTAVITALALCLGIAAMVSPVQAKETRCIVESCDYGQIWHTVCCPERVKVDPDCHGKFCEYEWVLVCEEVLCPDPLLN